jgi:carboxylesterase
VSEDVALVLSLDPPPRRIQGIGSDIKAPGVMEVAYAEIPFVCMQQVTELVSLTRDMLHDVVCPALIIHSHEDHVVPAANAMEIVRALNSDDIRLLRLRNSYHVATLDNDKDLIVERVGGFFNEVTKTGAPQGLKEVLVG